MSDDLPALAFDHAAWTAHAACKGSAAHLFFPGRGETHAPAKAVCRTCPVSDECLQYALDNSIKHGIWGGMSERERRRIRAYARIYTDRYVS
jgi:WhiB family redox-sensing transcriptional regulator